jgi:hypothetical protein
MQRLSWLSYLKALGVRGSGSATKMKTKMKVQHAAGNRSMPKP